MNILELNGCSPSPLAHYLKALGILRLVTEQADDTARGWWEGERFRLATKLSKDELERFFLDKYEPTPIYNPWGGRSGFYPDNSEKSARLALEKIENSQHQRFQTYKDVIKTTKDMINTISNGKKPNDEKKEQLILSLRRSVRGKSTLWLDTVSAVTGAGDSLNVNFAAIFGTGGNEGSGSYTSAYMEAIDQCLIKASWNHSLPMTLFGSNEVSGCIWNKSMGQFMPNCPGTPWDLLLAFEGACTVRSAVASRNTIDSTKWMASPFFVAPTSSGYMSESRADEYALKNGKERSGNGEQWFPLWSRPILFSELNHTFLEGRAATNKKRAVDGWSMARAISSLGVQKGITEFVRYGYQQRNNQATHFAVPLGRFRVPEKISPKLACLDDLDTWLSMLRKQARHKDAPARLRHVERGLFDALFAVTQHPEEASRWQAVLVCMADVEAVLRTGSGFKAGPIPKLRPEWVTAADDLSPEFRLALSCALSREPIRQHWLPLENNGRFKTSGNSLQSDVRVVMQGRDGVNDAIHLVLRRLIDAEQHGERRLPITPGFRASARQDDLAELIAGNVDLNRTMTLARALMALDKKQWTDKPLQIGHSSGWQYPDDAWLMIRLNMLPCKLPDGKEIPVDPAIVRRLANGDAATAVNLALRRLRSAGIISTVRMASVAPETARLWAAALAFPITKNIAADFVRRLNPNTQTKEEKRYAD